MGLYKTLGSCHPKLERGQVWCTTCGSTQKVESARCLKYGWPKCCGYTMTIDSPAEHPGRFKQALEATK